MYFSTYIVLTVVCLTDMVSMLLFPFGATAGDNVFDASDDNAYPLDLVNPFVFYGQAYNRLYFTDNGIISTEVYYSYVPKDIDDTIYPPIILLYHDDHKATNRFLYARESFAASDLALAKVYVDDLYPSNNVDVVSVAIFTWYQLPMFSENPDVVNTFQGVLVSTRTVSVILGLYQEITTNRRIPVIGLSAGDGVQYTELPESGDANAALDLDITIQGTIPGLRGFLEAGFIPTGPSNECLCAAKNLPQR